MTRKPQGDLDALVVPKGGNEAPRPAPSVVGEGYSRTLSLRLNEQEYRRLRKFVAGEEDRTGKRVTHQAVIETALAEYLGRNGG